MLTLLNLLLLTLVKMNLVNFFFHLTGLKYFFSQFKLVFFFFKFLNKLIKPMRNKENKTNKLI